MATEPQNCVICGHPVEEWHGGGGYGNNPAPITNEGRACNWCNQNVIIPVRLRRTMVTR